MKRRSLPGNPYDFNLNLKYKQLSFKLITESKVTVPIKVTVKDEDNDTLLYEKVTETNKSEDILVDVTGCNHISISAKYSSVLDDLPGKNATYIVDMKAK